MHLKNQNGVNRSGGIPAPELVHKIRPIFNGATNVENKTTSNCSNTQNMPLYIVVSGNISANKNVQKR